MRSTSRAEVADETRRKCSHRFAFGLLASSLNALSPRRAYGNTPSDHIKPLIDYRILLLPNTFHGIFV